MEGWIINSTGIHSVCTTKQIDLYQAYTRYHTLSMAHETFDWLRLFSEWKGIMLHLQQMIKCCRTHHGDNTPPLTNKRPSSYHKWQLVIPMGITLPSQDFGPRQESISILNTQCHAFISSFSNCIMNTSKHIYIWWVTSASTSQEK